MRPIFENSSLLLHYGLPNSAGRRDIPSNELREGVLQLDREWMVNQAPTPDRLLRKTENVLKVIASVTPS
jgi:hypothetical protein